MGATGDAEERRSYAGVGGECGAAEVPDPGIRATGVVPAGREIPPVKGATGQNGTPNRRSLRIHSRSTSATSFPGCELTIRRLRRAVCCRKHLALRPRPTDQELPRCVRPHSCR